MVLEADLSVRILSDGRHDLAARRARPAAAREAVDERRGTRAPLLLRLGVGGVLGSTGAVAPVEGRAADARRRRVETPGIPEHPGVGRQPGSRRSFATNATNRPRRARRL